jgi:hypothetical protein
VRLPRFSQWEVVELQWVDSAGAGEGWHKLKPKETQIEGCVSAGMVCAQDQEAVTLVLSRDTTNKNVCSAITIPTCTVSGYRRLR